MEPSQYFEPAPRPDNRDEGSTSLVGSLAHTVTSTIVDGLVHTIQHWRVILLGQLVSMVLTVAGGTNEILSLECGVSAPSTYNACGYFLVGLFGAIAMKREERKKLKSGGTVEECETFRNVNSDGSHKGMGNDDQEEDDDEGDLTDDEGSVSKRSIFSIRNSSTVQNLRPKRDRERQHSLDNGKIKRQQQQYPFLFGLFTIHAKWYAYLAVAIIEAQAYYLIFLAFRYTSFTFVYVSDALAIPASMIFTKLIMKRGYLWTHLVGGAVCMAGIVVNTVGDMNHNGHSDEHDISASDHIKGDIFAILGAILLGLDDVLSEIIVSDYGGVTEMLFMKGFYGTLISILQLFLFEMNSLKDLFSSAASPCNLSWRMILLSTHVIFRALDVFGEMQFLYVSEAALLNLMLLTSDLYAAIFDIIRVGLELTPFYYLAFFLIFFGIVLYEAGPSPAAHHTCTPLDIEFRQKARNNSTGNGNISIESTEHAGNLSLEDHPHGREIELT